MPACRWCRQEIKWAKTERGKTIPLDIHPNPDGNVELVNGIARVISTPGGPGDVRHMPHHATCPSPFNPSNQKRKQ